MNARISPSQQLHWIPSPPTLKQHFAQQPAGSWVAVSADRKRVVGRGTTPGKAEHAAKQAGQDVNFLVRVPDSSHRSSNRSAKTNGHGNGNGSSQVNTLSLPSLYRGIYKRVAHKLHCDPSYVSRVARGERMSDKVSGALQIEIDRTLSLFRHAGQGDRRRASQR
jgi:hypothetical protein